jgi:TolB-like protein/DNA-binding winged helix-turn-helix (wHTH) protein
MEKTTPAKLRVGDWCVNPAAGELLRNGESVRVDVRTMRLLTCLAEHAGEVVSIEELLDQVWAGVTVSSDSVYQAVATLRRLLGDDPRQPRYIATVPRLGYRMLAAVSPWEGPSKNGYAASEFTAGSDAEPPVPAKLSTPAETSTPSEGSTRSSVLPKRWLVVAISLIVCVAVAGFLFLRWRSAGARNVSDSVAQTQKSIAVLPFLDLTAGMKEEEFADGMTEELIDKLSKIPDLRVPAPTASFYYKGKQAPVSEIARTLGVAYIVDGSVRKSGSMIRVAARLVRADNGYVIWSETYDRPFDDRLMVQDDIAGEVTKALRASPELKAR